MNNEVVVEDVVLDVTVVDNGGDPVVVVEEETAAKVVEIVDVVGSGVSETFTATAEETVSALQVVRHTGTGVVVAAAVDGSANVAVCGVAITAATSGNSVTIRRSGLYSDGSWSWTPGPVFLGSAGQLTQTAPGAGSVVQVGVATAPDTIIVDIQPIILLA